VTDLVGQRIVTPWIPWIPNARFRENAFDAARLNISLSCEMPLRAPRSGLCRRTVVALSLFSRASPVRLAGHGQGSSTGSMTAMQITEPGFSSAPSSHDHAHTCRATKTQCPIHFRGVEDVGRRGVDAGVIGVRGLR